MNKAATTKMVASILSAVRTVVAKSLAPIAEKVEALQKSITELPIPKNGEDGKQGQQGDAGAKGAQGEIGEKGDQGPEGRDGRDGLQGDAGRDALQIEVLPTIDETRSYPRGTFASFRGGLVRSLRNTDALHGSDLARAGWSVLVQGIASESEEFSEDGRTEKRITNYTDGSKLERTVVRSFLLDRGVFKDDAAYLKGDGVTFGGSFWIAQKDAPIGKPGTTPDFRLAVKKGRDAETTVRNTRTPPNTVKLS